ncbi:hypothetical protein pipiens_013249 [Culex pipiens pipiens]|uniref:CUB domain-containing protein n=1 Tax=Culex pipiens pipiens TaxID=38569 RepID=A0ABD1CZ30_CULPP
MNGTGFSDGAHCTTWISAGNPSGYVQNPHCKWNLHRNPESVLQIRPYPADTFFSSHTNAFFIVLRNAATIHRK